MANTLMGDLQAAFRSITGSVQSYEGDWHTYLDTQGVPKGQWDARVWQYGNLMGLRNHTASSAHEYFLHQGAIGTVSAYAGGFTASGDYFSTPDSVANSITGDITLIVEAALDDWTPSAVNVLVAKDSVSAGGRSYALNIQTSGAPRFNFSLDGSTIISVTADAIPAFTDGIRSHIAVERTADTGKVRFYTSPDHITWTLLGTEQTAATGNIFDGNAVVQFGNLASLAYDLKGKIYDSEGYAGLAISRTDAVLKFDFDPEDSTGGSSWTSSETGEVWTANGGAYAYKYWGYSPTLSLNFLTGTLDSRITFTRASGATYTDSAGVLQLATSNTPRFDYDPVTLSAKGLLIEEQRTNLLLNSDTLSTQNVTVTAVATTLSFYGTGTVVLSGTCSGTLVGTGAYPNRVSLTFTPTAGTLTLTVTGSVRQAQLEAGSFATSYIPTTSAQATRAADVAVMTGTNFSSWYNQSEGTVYTEFDSLSTLNGTQSIALNKYPSLWYIEAGASDTYVYWYGSQAEIYVGNTYNNIGSVPTLTVNKLCSALSATSGNSATSLNGGTAVTRSGVLAGTSTALGIGNNSAGGSITIFNGHIRSFAYYNTRLSNTQLQKLTA